MSTAASSISSISALTCRPGWSISPKESVDTLFRAADLAVFPYTHFDAQSAAGTLALSFGVPMVVSDVGGLPDLVDDRRAVVPANDERALAEALVEILRDDSLRAKLAADGERRAGELGWDVIARKTADVYRSLI
ncbi:MAG: glycosyltransferase family 4 protein [Chloroflexi bacterium]|nr:glycosyltransferase family 4 protein [Chloroflexota bacterium]